MLCMCMLLRNRHTGSGYRNHLCSRSFSRDVAVERRSRELYNNTLLKGKEKPDAQPYYKVYTPELRSKSSRNKARHRDVACNLSCWAEVGKVGRL